ncbi:MauE/DoxX family redox-associated membrane protein [Kocuria sp.]|uniref:MauE/DoxX family redox-associated membrane protein n=1 Tax=Kocuria sp. TaxID=1871328 RepID=UPI0026E10DE4|nr:MauE/DoxX family redox-associated membrane protein [Kocuria sp.]MDO5619711.1 hypothetical protein [Kocuria sp.]
MATATVAVVLVISGLLKVRQPQAVDRAFADLQVPSVLQATWLRRSFPWLETLLGVAILVLSGPLLVFAAVMTVAVFSAYMVLIARAAASEQTVECNCFGAAGRAAVTGWTVLRNIGLLAVAVVVLAGTLTQFASWSAAVGSNPALLIGCAPAIGIMALIWKDQTTTSSGLATGPAQTPVPVSASRQATNSQSAEAAEIGEDEYIREPIPRYVLRQGSGEHVPVVTLRQLVARGPVLLVRLNPGCGSCEVMMSQWQDYQNRLGTTVHMLPVLSAGTTPGQTLGELDPQHYLYDHQLGLDALFEVGGTPWAVLLGADGWLAGGPELGVDGIEQMIAEIQEVLQGTPEPVAEDHA